MHGRDVYDNFIRHSSVSNAVLQSTNYTQQNAIRVDFTDKRTIRFTVNGVPVYRAIMNNNPGFVNYRSVKYISSSYNRRDTYENWGDCRGLLHNSAIILLLK